MFVSKLVRKLATSVLRATYKAPQERTVAEGGATGSRPGPGVRLIRPVARVVGRLLTPRAKARFQEWLINRFRIPVSPVPERQLEGVLRTALDRLVELEGPEALGDYLEFGTYQGNSLACMHRVLESTDLEQVRLFGFDSFQGLPDDGDMDGTWYPGQFRSSLEFTRQRLTERGVDWSRITLIPGFYSQSLNPSVLRRHRIDKASIILVDCDLYSSTRDVLAFCVPLIRTHAVILFDDWHSTADGKGEKRAFAEILQRRPDLRIEELPSYDTNARVLLVSRQEVCPAAGQDPAVPGLERVVGILVGGGVTAHLLELLPHLA